MKDFRWYMPTEVVSGAGCLDALPKRLGALGKRPLFITGRTSARRCGALDRIQAAFPDAPVFDAVEENPSTETCEAGAALCRERGCDVVVGIGGGSPMDTAKVIAMLACNPGRCEDYFGRDVFTQGNLPIVAVPTTAGTGSEVTQFTIITDTDRNVKMLIASPRIIPRIAIVDPLMTMTMPQAITAATGIDALTHAIEAYVSVKAHAISDALALHAIGLIAAHLRQAWCNADNVEARVGMSTAALEAGLAFSNASVALVHGMARPIGAYFHIGHGLSNAVLLPTVVEFSIPGNVKRYADIAAALGERVEGLSLLDAAARAPKALTRLNEDLRVPSLRGLGIEQKALEEVVGQMAQDALASGSPGNNPRKATKDEIVELYKKAY